MTETPLDSAHAAMDAEPDDDAARLRFFERLADAELFLLLEGEADGDRISPRVFPVDGQRLVLLFDREERLARFAGGPADYAGMSGRNAVAMLSGQGLGIGLNLDVASSSMLLPAEAVDWLAATLTGTAEEVDAHPDRITSPAGIPEALLSALDTKLALSGGLAKVAYLAGASYKNQRKGHLLAFIDAVPGAEPGLTAAVREALVFSGVDAGELDVAFFQSSDPVAAMLARNGLRFDLPEPAGTSTGPTMPGMDPNRPPILR